MGVRLPFEDRDAVCEELRRFGKRGGVPTGEGWPRIEFGSAHVDGARQRRFGTGMPLHEFEREGVVELVEDHDAGSKSTTGPTRPGVRAGEASQQSPVPGRTRQLT